MKKASIFRRSVSCILLLLLLLTMCGCSSSSGAASAEEKAESKLSLDVYFFAAGKADAILLTTEKSAVLIDCGEKGFGQTILETLYEKKIDRIDYLIVTHFDQDHVGGAAKVINNFPIGTVLQSNCPRDSEEYEKYVKALGNAGLKPVTVSKTTDFTLDGVRFSVDPPRKDDYKNDDSNNSSLIVTVNCGEKTLLFMGDAERERLKEYLSYTTLDCDLIKIPHHGGEDSQMDELIAATKPEYAVICCSGEEPDISATRSVLESAGVQIFLTSHGPVTATCDGKELAVSENKQ